MLVSYAGLARIWHSDGMTMVQAYVDTVDERLRGGLLFTPVEGEERRTLSDLLGTTEPTELLIGLGGEDPVLFACLPAVMVPSGASWTLITQV